MTNKEKKISKQLDTVCSLIIADILEGYKSGTPLSSDKKGMLNHVVKVSKVHSSNTTSKLNLTRRDMLNELDKAQIQEDVQITFGLA